MATPKPGGEVDAFCTKCRMTLAHTVLAMVGSKVARVECNTCHGQHAYRTEPGTKRPATPRAPSPRKEVISFEQRVAEKDASKARQYSPKDTYALDELVNHPTFGLGIVSVVRQDKVDVTFKAFEKILVHGRGEGGAAARPAYAPPPAKISGPADKPQPPEAEGASAPSHPSPQETAVEAEGS